jgi:hypothetical protein
MPIELARPQPHFERTAAQVPERQCRFIMPIVGRSSSGNFRFELYPCAKPYACRPLVSTSDCSGCGLPLSITEGTSSYNALQLGIQKRMSRGLQAQGSFTWGKSMDTSSGTVTGDQWTNSLVNAWNWFNPRACRAVSDFNISKTFVLDVTWNVPGLKSVSGLAGCVTSGWQSGGIYTASDGVPFTASFGTDGDPLGLNSSTPFDVPNRLIGPGCASLTNPGNPNNYIKTQCFAIPTAPSAAFYQANCDPSYGTFPQCFNLEGNSGRNILTGPGLSELDFSIFKKLLDLQEQPDQEDCRKLQSSVPSRALQCSQSPQFSPTHEPWKYGHLRFGGSSNWRCGVTHLDKHHSTGNSTCS